MLDIFLRLAVLIAGVVLGGYILLFGRQALAATSGIITLAAGANLLAVFVAGTNRGSDLVDEHAWISLVVVLALGIIGTLLGRYRRELAVDVIGFLGGANVTLWLYQIARYVVTSIPDLPEDSAIWVGVALVLTGGFLGVKLVRWNREEALILLSVLVGVEVISDALGLRGTSSVTALVVLTLALAGVLMQYGMYLRSFKPNFREALYEPEAAGMELLQNLNLD